MAAARRWEILPVVALVLLVGLRAWQEISLFILVADAPVAAVSRLPLVVYWAPVLVAVLGGGLVAIHAAWKAADARRVRLLYLMAFIALVVDAFFLPASRLSPIVTSDSIALVALEAVRPGLQIGEGGGVLPAEADSLEKALEVIAQAGLGPQYLEEGKEVEHWRAVLVPGCEAPLLEVGEHRVGTVLYCLAPDRRSGSLTVVGTGGVLAGSPAMARTQEGPVIVPLQALPKAAAADSHPAERGSEN